MFYKFISHTDDFQVGLQIIRFALDTFLPYLSLVNSSENLLRTYLPSLRKCFEHSLEDLVKEDLEKIQEHIEVNINY